MNDREKQIERMETIIFESCEGKSDEYCTELTCSKCHATNLYNANCRILDESSVVISKEEYERFQRMENTLKRISTVSPTEAESENKALKETIGIVLAQKRNIWNSYNQLKEEIDYKIDQARKQAVKEVLERLKAYIDQNEVQTTYFGNKCFIDKEKIDEIAKEIGVEL